MSLLKRIFLSLALLLLAACSPSAQSVESMAKDMIIVVNQDDPDSLAIGQYYAQKRGIPESNIVSLSTSTKETITIEEYVETVANPLLNAMLENKWVKGVKASSKDRYGRERLVVSVHRIPYVVLIRGVPLRIANDSSRLEAINSNIPKQFRVNNGSVDGEVALLLAPANLSMSSSVPNPYFNGAQVSSTDANRLLKVSRLDGGSKDSVIRLIDRTLEAEEIGLMGRAYIDLGGPHSRGDEWIRDAGEMAAAAHFDTNVESSKRLMDLRDRYDAPAIYMGWYKNKAYAQWTSKRLTVPVGAIGFHLHSFSATSVRNKKTWLSAFIEQGYCATVGNVYEPYLNYTHHPHIFLQHLIGGGNFGDAVMLSMPVLSWQNVAIGDPLYRPFKVDLKTQLSKSNDAPFFAYALIREINRLHEQEGSDTAIRYARKAFTKQPSLALAYRLAQLYESSGEDEEAVSALGITRYITVFTPDEMVLAQEAADLLHQLGESERALNIYKNILKESLIDKWLKISLYESGSNIARSCGESQIASNWELEALRLKPKPKPKK